MGIEAIIKQLFFADAGQVDGPDISSFNVVCESWQLSFFNCCESLWFYITILDRYIDIKHYRCYETAHINEMQDQMNVTFKLDVIYKEVQGSLKTSSPYLIFHA